MGCLGGFASSWPEYATEWADQLAQAGGEEAEQAKEQAVKNWVKVVPTSVEIMRMETAIVWPGRYLAEIPQLLRTVGAVAVAGARYQPIAAAARRLKLSESARALAPA